MLDGSCIKVAKVYYTAVADFACRGVEAKTANDRGILLHLVTWLPSYVF